MTTKINWTVKGAPFDMPKGATPEDYTAHNLEFVGPATPVWLAEWWAARYDQETTEYSIAGQQEDFLVTVENCGTGARWQYRVAGRSEPVYTARLLEEETP